MKAASRDNARVRPSSAASSAPAASWRGAALIAIALGAAACGRPAAPAAPPAAHLLLVTIDTLRADRVGAYGHGAARTPAIDGLARAGVRFDRAFSVAPITLPAHASLLSGRLPPAHGARHNGQTVAASLPTLATTLHDAGFATAAFVAAFPLDRRFGLSRGFDVYGDRWPRGSDGRPANERPGRQVVDEALAWLATVGSRRAFLWVHLFEPHAPYGAPGAPGTLAQRYDAEIAEADRQVARLLDGLGPRRAETLVIVAADHGEAFGEHGESGHSVFVYDTTLRVPLVVAGPGLAPRVVADPVSVIDVLPTALARLGVAPLPAVDGLDLSASMQGAPVGERVLYAESFAPRLDFGWSPLRAVRAGGRKYIAAPRPELFDVAGDPGELHDLAGREAAAARRLAALVDAMSPADLTAAPADRETTRRLQSLGYLASRPAARDTLADPKDRRELAAALAEVTSGELTGAALETALRRILAADAGNPQAHLRLGVVLAETRRCAEAEPHFTAAMAAGLPSADPYLGLAGCLVGRGRAERAAAVLAEGAAVEPDNPVVLANQGLLLSDGGRPVEAAPLLRRAVDLDPEFHQARFGLAIALARAGDRIAAEREARSLFDRLPADALQRPEVARLLDALR